MKRIEVYEYPETLIAYLMANKMPFTMERTSGRIKIDSSLENLVYNKFSTADFPKKDMWFFNYLKKNLLQVQKQDLSELKTKTIYISHNWQKLEQSETLKNYVEIDINGAYWLAFKLLGFISDDVYKKGFLVSKRVRLASLGALAKSPYITTFDGYKWSKEKLPPPETAFYFFSATKLISDLINNILGNINFDNYAFYWVDAIFVHESERDFVIKSMADVGFDCKTKEIEKIIFNNKESQIKTIFKKENKVNEKIYNLAKVKEFDSVEDRINKDLKLLDYINNNIK
jgi:hypothetical protein